MGYDRLTAAHEAAHVVVLLAAGVVPDAAMITTARGLTGWVKWRDSGKLSAEDRAAFAVAGEVGELLAQGRQPGGALARCLRVWSDSADRRELLTALTDLEREQPGRGRQALGADAVTLAAGIIRQNRAVYDAIVEQLERDGIMSGGQFRRLRAVVRVGPAPDVAWFRDRLVDAEKRGNAQAVNVFRRAIAQREGKAVQPVVEYAGFDGGRFYGGAT